MRRLIFLWLDSSLASFYEEKIIDYFKVINLEDNDDI